MLRIENLSVTAEGRKVVDSATLKIGDGEVHVVMGPNGAGKSSLAYAIMGNPDLKAAGKLAFDGESLLELTPDRRAAKGIFLAFQHPQEVEGVKSGLFVRKAKATLTGEKQTLGKMMETQERFGKDLKRLGLPEAFVQRELNVGFSGGEKKRLEMVQMLSLEPKLVILDEIDSGLDIDGLKLVAKAIKGMMGGKRSFLIITHYPRILRYVKPDYVHVMVAGKIVETGGAKLARELERKGYGKYAGRRAEGTGRGGAGQTSEEGEKEES